MKTWNDVYEVLSKQDGNDLYTKKGLEELYETSDVTISKSIESSTLPTSSREYTVSELLEWFIPARQMIEAGKKHEEVKQILLEKRKKASSEHGDNSGVNPLQVIQEELVATIFKAGFTKILKEKGGHIAYSTVIELMKLPEVTEEIVEYVTVVVENTFNQGRAIKAAKSTTQKLLKANNDEGEKQP